MKYLLLLNRAEDALPEPGTPAAQAMLREYTAAVQAMAEAGVLVDCAPLTATSAATTVRVRDGQPLLTDGPAAELREQVGGYTIMGRDDEAARAYRTALELEPPAAERRYIQRRLARD